METKSYLVGFARLDITPFLGVRMVDLGKDVSGTGVLDPLHVSAIAFSDGEKTAVMMSVDNHQICSPYSEQWPARIAEKLGLEESAVSFSCTHSHPTPCVNGDEEYAAWLYRRMEDAATMAVHDLKPVLDVQWAQQRAEGMAYTRRYRMLDGTVQTHPVRAERKMAGPAAPYDDSIRLIRFLRQDGDEIVLINFQSHPGNDYSRSYSADYPGLLCSGFERKKDDVRVIFFNGAEGEMITRGPEPFSKDNPYGWSLSYSKRLTEIALGLYDKTVSTGIKGFSYGKRTVAVKTKRDSSRYEEAKRILALFREKRMEEIHPNSKLALCMAGEAGQIVRLEEAGEDFREIAVNAVGFCGVAMVGISGEPFSEIGVQIREASKYPVTCVCCMTNGSKGYMPTDEAFEQGGYETYNTPLTKGIAGQVTDAAVSLLASL